MVRKVPDLPMAPIVEVCRKYGVSELAVFGSLLRDDFGPESDVDFLVSFENDDTGPWMCFLTRLEEELGTILHRKVDVVYRKGLEKSENKYRREDILNSAIILYES